VRVALVRIMRPTGARLQTSEANRHSVTRPLALPGARCTLPPWTPSAQHSSRFPLALQGRGGQGVRGRPWHPSARRTPRRFFRISRFPLALQGRGGEGVRVRSPRPPPHTVMPLAQPQRILNAHCHRAFNRDQARSPSKIQPPAKTPSRHTGPLTRSAALPAPPAIVAAGSSQPSPEAVRGNNFQPAKLSRSCLLPRICRDNFQQLQVVEMTRFICRAGE
jgi:hypothetical protein